MRRSRRRRPREANVARAQSRGADCVNEDIRATVRSFTGRATSPILPSQFHRPSHDESLKRHRPISRRARRSTLFRARRRNDHASARQLRGKRALSNRVDASRAGRRLCGGGRRAALHGAQDGRRAGHERPGRDESDHGHRQLLAGFRSVRVHHRASQYARAERRAGDTAAGFPGARHRADGALDHQACGASQRRERTAAGAARRAVRGAGRPAGPRPHRHSERRAARRDRGRRCRSMAGRAVAHPRSMRARRSRHRRAARAVPLVLAAARVLRRRRAGRRRCPHGSPHWRTRGFPTSAP